MFSIKTDKQPAGTKIKEASQPSSGKPVILQGPLFNHGSLPRAGTNITLMGL